MSAIIDGKVLDFHYKKGGQDFITNFYIGDIYIGQIFKMQHGYSVVGKTPNPLGPIDGLRTRWQAAQLLLRMEGIWK
jgi:hypothetical protein